MPTGLEISKDFINEVVVPLLYRHLPGDMERLAVAVIGSGSDVLGLDDEISRDHHWGPRAAVMFRKEDGDELKTKIENVLANSPKEFRGYPVAIDITNMTGLCTAEIEAFFAGFLGQGKIPPEHDSDWLKLCEVDLFHVTAGVVVYDGTGTMNKLRRQLEYYPEIIWKKKIADWCMYLSGRDSPYNYHRVSKRGDELTGRIYLANYIKRAMEFCFTLNRVYAPYTKWLNTMMRRLPKYSDTVAPMLDELIRLTDPRAIVLQQVELNYFFADVLAELGLTKPPVRQAFDESLTDLVLYYSAAEIYRTLPVEYLDVSFNQIEYWEAMARKAILDPNDFVQKK